MACSDQRILVTGASGFIGRHLCRRFTRERMDYIAFDGDVRSLDDLLRYENIGTVIHLAARVRGHYTREEIEEVNVGGTENVLRFACERNAEVIHASSYLYASAGDLPLSEDTATTYWNHYSFTKWQAEQLFMQYQKEHGLSALVLRIFNAYGPEQQLGYLVPDLLDGLKKEHLKLKNTSPRRDFIHVDDIVELIVRGSRGSWSGFEVVNVGTGVGHSVLETIKLIVALTGREVPIESDDKPVAIGCAIADISKAKQMFDWSPKITLSDGLRGILKSDGFQLD